MRVKSRRAHQRPHHLRLLLPKLHDAAVKLRLFRLFMPRQISRIHSRQNLLRRVHVLVRFLRGPVLVFDHFFLFLAVQNRVIIIQKIQLEPTRIFTCVTHTTRRSLVLMFNDNTRRLIIVVRPSLMRRRRHVKFFLPSFPFDIKIIIFQCHQRRKRRLCEHFLFSFLCLFLRRSRFWCFHSRLLRVVCLFDDIIRVKRHRHVL